MKIEILCRDGSPLGVTSASIYGEDGRIGVGGAELALLTMCEEWAKAGHEVILYNDPKHGSSRGFDQRSVSSFIPKDKRDVLITFRTPNPRSIEATGLKVWWSTDQYTIDNFKHFAPHMERIVCISPFHQEYFRATYQIHDTVSIDLPVRVQDYEASEVEKIPYRCLYSSVPDRGLMILHAAWPLIQREVPEATLVITSDYRLWGLPVAQNEKFRMRFLLHPNTSFLGAVKRLELVKEQLRAEVLTYPCTYEELFCYSVAEAQVAGAYPITTQTGALATTNMECQLPGSPHSPVWVDQYVGKVVEFLRRSPEDKRSASEQMRLAALERFNPVRILQEWDEKVFNRG